MVWSFNNSTKEYVYKRVKKTFTRYSEFVISVTVFNETIKVTAENPFFINGSWLAAGFIKSGGNCTFT